MNSITHTQEATAGTAGTAPLELWYEATDLLHREAELLDAYAFSDWLELFDDDVEYTVPLARNVKYNERDRILTSGPGAVMWMADSKDTLSRRVQQLETGMHWAEEPLSRTCHIVTNIRVADMEPGPAGPAAMTVHSVVTVYRNRVETETDWLVGRRTDRLVRHGSGWRIAKRTVVLAQNVLLVKNLTVFL